MKKWIDKICSRLYQLKYRRKLQLVLICTGFFPLVIMGTFMVLRFMEILSQNEYEAMRSSLNQVCAAVETQKEIYENLANYIVYDADLQSVLKKEQELGYSAYQEYTDILDPMLNTPRFFHSGICRLTVYAETVQIPHDTTLAPLSDIEETDWFEELGGTGESMWVWPDDGSEECFLIRKFPGMGGKAAKRYIWEFTAAVTTFCSRSDPIREKAEEFFFTKEKT
ncbi:MAG: hypothetical protein PUG60_09620 [Lachnospiraceae bacterium]|nr:hypothetical protein [Lachnospiraceae bacterium]